MSPGALNDRNKFNMPTLEAISHAQWAEFLQQGFVRLGVAVADAELAVLQRQVDRLMLVGSNENVDCENMLMQLQLGSNQNGPQSTGWKGSTLNYRKIQGLEYDPVTPPTAPSLM